MARNLSRNTRLFVSTIAPANFGDTNCTTANTWEVKVLDGYSFSQDVATVDIGVSEAASECSTGGLARGTLGFNTALNPVDVSFSTYVRPYLASGPLGSAVEKPLWGAAMGDAAHFVTAPGATSIWNNTTTELNFVLTYSDTNTLQTLYLYFVLQNTTYVVTEFTVGTAEVDFSIDGIATINWSGSGTTVNEYEEINAIIADTGTFIPGTDFTAVPETTSSSFLRNKLSVLEFYDNSGALTGDETDAIDTGGVSGTAIPVTGITTAIYAGGRVRNTTSSPNEWAQIISNTTTSIVVSAADEALVGTWSVGDTLEVYTSTTHSQVIYCVPITGGTLTLENNMSYLTPEELAIVNQPLAGFTGSRAVSGSFTAYLNTGAQGTGGLLQDLLSKITETNNDYTLIFHMGGTSSATPRVDFTIPHARISIPTTNVEDIISTEISFSAQPWTGTGASFEGANDMTIDYVLG